MRDLVRSLEKSIEFFNRRYPDGHPMLDSLQEKLAILKANKKDKIDSIISEWKSTESPCCEELDGCAFFYAVANVDEVFSEMKQYMATFCCGPDTESCYRLQYKKQHGEAAPDNISPTGEEY